MIVALVILLSMTINLVNFYSFYNIVSLCISYFSTYWRFLNLYLYTSHVLLYSSLFCDCKWLHFNSLYSNKFMFSVETLLVFTHSNNKSTLFPTLTIFWKHVPGIFQVRNYSNRVLIQHTIALYKIVFI